MRLHEEVMIVALVMLRLYDHNILTIAQLVARETFRAELHRHEACPTDFATPDRQSTLTGGLV